MQINENLQGNMLPGANEVVQPANVEATSHNQNFSSILNELNSFETNLSTSQQIPSWVDPDYGYDPLNPRKPNLKELMSIIDAQVESGIEEKKYLNSSSNIVAADILYGVVGSDADTRDWKKIMESENVLAAAHQETATLHEPKLEIVSEFNADMVLVDQKAAIKNKNDDTLMVLGGSALQVKEKLFNIGITDNDIPENIAEQITVDNFEVEVIAGILDFTSQFSDTESEPNTSINMDYNSSLTVKIEPQLIEETNEINVLSYLSARPEYLPNTDLFLNAEDGSS